MPKRNLERNIGFLLHDVSRLMRKEYNKRARDLDLTRSQSRVIAHLYRTEGVTQTELAEILEIEPATLARLIDRLEAAEWVERRPCEKDRRAKRLFLTDRPEGVIDEIFDISKKLQEDVLRGFSTKEQADFVDSLLVVKRNLLDFNSNTANEDAGTPEPAPRRRAAAGG
jgi:MarR family transcriptional regulator for hemolysin